MIEAVLCATKDAAISHSDCSVIFSSRRFSGRDLGDIIQRNSSYIANLAELQQSIFGLPKSWSVDVASIDPQTFDLSVKNPNGTQAVAHRSPQEIMAEIAALDAESAAVLGRIRGLL